MASPAGSRRKEGAGIRRVGLPDGGLTACLAGASSVSACLVEPPGPRQPRQSARVGGRQLEGEVVGLAHLYGLLEQAAKALLALLIGR